MIHRIHLNHLSWNFKRFEPLLLPETVNQTNDASSKKVYQDLSFSFYFYPKLFMALDNISIIGSIKCKCLIKQSYPVIDFVYR